MFLSNAFIILNVKASKTTLLQFFRGLFGNAGKDIKSDFAFHASEIF